MELMHSHASEEPRNAEPTQPLAVIRVISQQADPHQVYEEIVRRGTPEERKKVEDTLASLPDKERNICELLTALQKGDWNAAIFNNAQYPLYALEAVRQGKLFPNDYATVVIFWEMHQLHKAEEITTVPLFNPDGTANEEAKDLIKQTLTYRKNAALNPLLSNDKINTLFDKMRALHPLQQQLWIVPHIHEPIINAISLKTLAEIGEEDMMVAPMGLMQTFLEVAFGEDAVKLIPVHGLSSWKDLRQNLLEGKREYALRSPLIFLPDKADAHYARDFYFGKHDFYHALLISAVLTALRKYFVATYDSIQRKYNDPNKGCGFIDMETIILMNHFIAPQPATSISTALQRQLEETALFSARLEKVIEALGKNPNLTIGEVGEHVRKNSEEIDRQSKIYCKQIQLPTEPIWAL